MEDTDISTGVQVLQKKDLLTVQNVALLNDIVRLPKNVLISVCTDLDLPPDGGVDELTSKIWGKISKNREFQDQALASCRDRLLCGRISAMWYSLASGATLLNSKELVIKNLGYNPFVETRLRTAHELTTVPVVINGTVGKDEHEYFLRFMYKTRNARNFFGASMESIPRSNIGTVYINETSGCIEVRADRDSAPKIAAAYARLINQQVTIEPKKFSITYGNNIESIAEKLEGTLMATSAKPELNMDEISIQQASAIVAILSAIDKFFEDEDIDALRASLIDAMEAFGEELITLPFLARVLSGLGKVGLDVQGTKQDLREAPLYEALKPFLQSQEGHIRFPVNEDGILTYYTIRVGMKTNSIFFVSSSTENAIRTVRDRVIM